MTPAWAVWLALGLWGVAIAGGAVAFVAGRRLWRQLAPQIMPLVSMFAGGNGAQGEPATTQLAEGYEPPSSSGHETPAGDEPCAHSLWANIEGVPTCLGCGVLLPDAGFDR